MDIIYKIKNYLFPEIDPEVQKHLDRDSMSNLYRISIAILIFETLSMLIYVYSSLRTSFKDSNIISLKLVAFCIVICIFGSILSRYLSRKEDLQHRTVIIFKFIVFALLTVWAIISDFRHYRIHEQMLTFFTVELMTVCFFMFLPWESIILMGGAYLGLFSVLYAFDGASGIQLLNFSAMMFLSIIGMITMFHHQKNLAIESIQLEKRTKMYEEISHHDALTGVWNRFALEEDEKNMVGRDITAYMIDINDFKFFNDKYGHATGDSVLKKTCDELTKLFPNGKIYRYGGDEFLVICESSDEFQYEGELHMFNWYNKRRRVNITLCIGKAKGTPENREEFYQLISKADELMYRIKKRTHSRR